MDETYPTHSNTKQGIKMTNTTSNRRVRIKQVLLLNLLTSIMAVSCTANPLPPATATTPTAGSSTDSIGTSPLAPILPIPQLEVAPYMGLWYQVAYYPNRFQKHCVANTTATYLQIQGSSTIEVLNQCQRADGSWDRALGEARAVAGVSKIETLGSGTGMSPQWLRPAQLQVSFLPRWLRWAGIGWGAYWVIDYAADGHYAVVSEPKRQYLWILARSPKLSASDRTTVHTQLQALGFDLQRLQDHPHTPKKPTSNP